jgi:hypothetical protein
MTQLDIHFANGREVLNAYWGYLSGGGLTIRRHEKAQELKAGQAVVLHVHIGTRRAFSVHGQVVRAWPDKIVIRFEAHDTQNRLLTEALAEQDIDMEARLSFTDTSSTTVKTARLFVLSEDGCGLRLSADDEGAPPDVGTEVAIEASGFRIDGCVVAASDSERCILFGSGSDAIEAVRAWTGAAD